MKTDKYDPVKSLREEVDRFKATNQFSPMLVTNFYAQAAVALKQLEMAEEENKRMKQRIRSLERQVNDLETELIDGE